MAATTADLKIASKKRKKTGVDSDTATKRRAGAKDSKDTTSSSTSSSTSSKQKIEELEKQISESRKYYNNIAALISMLNIADGANKVNINVAVSLCRVFCRLLAIGQLNRVKGASEGEQMVVAWLRERYQECQNALLVVLKEGTPSQQVTTLTLCFTLMKEQCTHLQGSETQVWTTGYFPQVVAALLDAPEGDTVRTEFMEKFATKYHDIAIYMVLALTTILSKSKPSAVVDNAIDMLSKLGVPPPADTEFEDFYSDITKIGHKQKTLFTSVTSFKRKVQEAWLAIFRNTLDEAQRKNLLRIMARQIVPWFIKPEMLMDFLTDSFDQGGSTSLLALSGLFYLIKERNLDYPHFYTKLYSLLDAQLLYSKHRSRFFRLLETFLASSHLPVNLVASFIKRLSRLALHAPPAAIVFIVPYIYNLFQSHRQCTFMLHREIRDESLKRTIEAQGARDPFNMSEPDPMLTNAIDSSVWELETLQSHYHPHVASVARIVAEQFTKPSYNIEDFLDHSYQSLLATELGAGLTEEKEQPYKKPPVVEFQIPKRIFTGRLLEVDGGIDNEQAAGLMRRLWDFS